VPLDQPADMAGVIQALGLQRPVVCGHSMGANTASALGARYPGLVRALILEDPGWRDVPPPPPDAAKVQPPPNPFLEMLKRIQEQNATVDQVIAYGRKNSPTWPEYEWLPWAESKLQLDTSLFNSLGPWKDWRADVRDIRVPTLLITADVEKGAIVTPETAAEAAALCPTLRISHVPNAGHSVRRENWPDFIQAVRDFLKTI
jgi:N-formylmaleamate deformylase